ncbi:LysR family transcriptional regulator [Cryptosporangium sp. NPDC051539]|uniref:LysR family transcriptional regulator n=1 Tax=Cryptosporangium sp. NPDC051539 TaxID=3363962 RepID=UPI0037A7A649
MEIRQLEYLLAVADEGSFTRASARLGVAQSAVSHQIGKLEDEFGLRLLHRDRPAVRPTEIGAIFVGRVTRALAELAAAKEEVLSLNGQTVGNVTFGATFPTGSLDVPAVLARFRTHTPAVHVTLREGTTVELLELVRTDVADMAVVAGKLRDLPQSLEGVVVGHDDLVLAGPSGHHLEGLSQVPLRELNGEAMVGFRRGAGLRAAVDAVLAEEDVSVNIMIESNELPVLIGLVQHGHGLAVLPRRFLVGAPAKVWHRDLQPRINPPLLLVWRRGRRYPPAAEEFLRFIVAEATRTGT